jgi:hypothetical protein
VDAEGRVQKFDRDGNLASFAGAQAILTGVVTLLERQPSFEDGAKAAAEMLRSSEYGQVLEQSMTNALKNLNAVALGTAIGQAIANTNPRTPP